MVMSTEFCLLLGRCVFGTTCGGTCFWRAKEPFFVKAAGPKPLLVALSGKTAKSCVATSGKRGMKNTFDTYLGAICTVTQA